MSELSAIRLDDGKAVDDVAISGDLFRMERMDDGVWWVCVYRGGKRTAFNLSSKSPIEATVIEDTIGCTDDTDRAGGQT
jgi:hypothetical protein